LSGLVILCLGVSSLTLKSVVIAKNSIGFSIAFVGAIVFGESIFVLFTDSVFFLLSDKRLFIVYCAFSYLPYFIGLPLWPLLLSFAVIFYTGLIWIISRFIKKILLKLDVHEVRVALS
jgi:hypothetical protein